MISYSKINLGLNILYKRIDGFHEINSIFLKINFGDPISFEKTQSQTIELVSQNELMLEKRKLFEDVSERGDFSHNILFKAFQKSKELFPALEGVKVFLTKRIPPGGGLGGGSSNAAELLKFLFKETSFLQSQEMIDLAASIGSDVPFFLLNGNAFVFGRGEKFNNIVVANGNGILVIPPFSINTKESYQYLKKPLQKTVYDKPWKLLTVIEESFLQSGKWSELKNTFKNEFEEYAFLIHPELASLKKALYNFGCSYASMTGSGSCMYGLVENSKLLVEIKEKLSQEYPKFQFISFTF